MDLREVLNAIRYLARSGGGWRRYRKSTDLEGLAMVSGVNQPGRQVPAASVVASMLFDDLRSVR
jgi:hypothetical protein